MRSVPYRRAAARTSILLQLQAAYPASMSYEAIFQGLKVSGFNADFRSAAAEIEYLCDRGYAVRAPSEISSGLLRARLSAKGEDYLEREGF